MWSSGKETALHLYKVKSHHYTNRTASLDPTLSQMKANLLNNTSKISHQLQQTSIKVITTLEIFPLNVSITVMMLCSMIDGYQLYNCAV